MEFEQLLQPTGHCIHVLLELFQKYAYGHIVLEKSKHVPFTSWRPLVQDVHWLAALPQVMQFAEQLLHTPATFMNSKTMESVLMMVVVVGV